MHFFRELTKGSGAGKRVASFAMALLLLLTTVFVSVSAEGDTYTNGVSGLLNRAASGSAQPVGVSEQQSIPPSTFGPPANPFAANIWDLDIVITANDPLQAGDTIQINVDLSLPSGAQWSLDYLDYEFSVLLSSYVPGSVITNPVIKGTNTPIFDQTLLNAPTTETIGGHDYNNYTFKFSDDAKDYFASNNESLLSISIVFNGFVSKDITTGLTDFDVVFAKDENGVISKGEVTITPPPTGEGALQLSKSLVNTFKKDGLGSYTKQGGGAYVENDDIAVFRITVKAVNGTAQFDKIQDSSTDGAYTILNPTDTITYDGSLMSVEDMLIASGLSNSGQAVDWVDDGVVGGKQLYTHTPTPSPHELKVGEEYSIYIVLKIEDTTKELRNYAYVFEDNDQKGTGNAKPNADEVYDMAITVAIDYIFDDQGGFTKVENARTTAHEAFQAPVVREKEVVRAVFVLRNQGTMDVDNVDALAFIPEGFEVIDADDSAKWAGWHVYISGGYTAKNQHAQWNASNPSGVPSQITESTFALGASSSYWSKLDVYSVSHNTSIKAGSSAVYYLYLQASDDTTLKPEDFYIAAEIYDFEHKGKSAGSGDIEDKDSTPGILYGGNPFPNLADTSITSEAKERHFIANEDAKSNSQNDEDDFDFTWVTMRGESSGNIEYDGDMLVKRRLDLAALNEFFLIMGNSTRDYVNSQVLKDYTMVNDSGLIESNNNYILYRLQVNPDGMEDTKNSKLTDTLPPGLKLLQFQQQDTNSSDTYTIDGIAVVRHEGTPKQLITSGEHAGKTHIVYEPGYYQTTPIQINDTATKHASLEAGASKNLSETKAGEQYDISYSVSSDGREITVEFGSNTTKATDAAYDIYLFVVLDTNKLVPDTVLKNSATYEYGGGTEWVEETTSVKWSSSSSSSYLKKFIKNAKGDYVASPDYIQLDINSGYDGTFTADYRLRLSSAGNKDTPAGRMTVQDKLPAYHPKVLSGPTISGYTYTLTGVEMQEGTPVASPENYIKATLSGQGSVLDVVNIQAIPANHMFYVDFEVEFSGVPHGTVVQNTVLGNSVYTVVPLKLELVKSDANTGARLQGYEFNAYYANAVGAADLQRPVKDIKGNPVVFTNAGQSFAMIPEGYQPSGSAREWNIVLKEEKAPQGYEGNQGKEYLMLIKQDTDGNLSFADNGSSDLTVNVYGNLKSAQVQVKNSKTVVVPGEGSAKLTKRDVDTGKVIAGALFGLEHLDGTDTANNAHWKSYTAPQQVTGADGTVEFTGLPEGTYRFVEIKAAPGYDKETARYAYPNGLAYFVITQGSGTQLVSVTATNRSEPENPGPRPGPDPDPGKPGTNVPDVYHPGEDRVPFDVVEIVDEDIPLAKKLLELIEDGDVPLGNLPRTGMAGSAIPAGMVMLGAVTAMAVCRRKNKI